MVNIELAARLEGIDPFGEDILLDAGIMEALPVGCRVISSSRSGQSLWVETMRIEVELSDSTIQVFFKKGAGGAAGLRMMKGAFDSEKALHKYIPEYVPRPVAVGTYKSIPDAHFYIADFVEMDEVHPNVNDWAKCLSTLHSRTMGKSPGGKFGFHSTNHLANIPLNRSWTSTWEECFSQLMRSLCEVEEERRGPEDNWTQAKKLLFEVVIPRYLRPMESEGRSVQPCLLHSDLWPGNARPRSDAPDMLCIFDSAAVWGHSELDLSVTRSTTYKLERHAEMYRELMGASEPQSDYDARIDLYALQGLVLRSAMYYREPERRALALQVIQKLADKAMTEPSLSLSNQPQADGDAAGEV